MGVFFQSFPQFQGILEGPLVHWLETEDLDKCYVAIHLKFYSFFTSKWQQVKMMYQEAFDVCKMTRACVAFKPVLLNGLRHYENTLILDVGGLDWVNKV